MHVEVEDDQGVYTAQRWQKGTNREMSAARRHAGVKNGPFLCVHGSECAIANDECPHFLHKHKGEKKRGEKGFIVRDDRGVGV